MLDKRDPSIAEWVRRTGGRTSGFDYLRVCLAIGVICVHSSSTSYGHTSDLVVWGGPQRAAEHIILPMFFALSGFLVAGSLERSRTLVSFFGLRILRIVPALSVEVLLSAMIFGPMLSSLALRAYFTNPEFHLYFLNITGDIHYLLPGVFLDNPIPRAVNEQLWTVPFELECYIALGGLAVIGIMGKRRLTLAIVGIGQCLWAWQAWKRGEVGGANGASGSILVLCFLVGILFFQYRDKIPISKRLFALSVLLCLGLGWLPHGTYYVPIPATYLTIYLGLQNPPRQKLLLSGDYSYGLYLYGFPVQQAFASLGPWAHHWYLNLIVCLPAAFLIACFSWHTVEKPALALRRYLPAIERKLARLVFGGTLVGEPAPAEARAAAIPRR
ncbi:MAG TPA: acyltransferase [Stellaceae bacterium]|jgi:peptidoglycan/LPS O-acetylase OafA/YrhL